MKLGTTLSFLLAALSLASIGLAADTAKTATKPAAKPAAKAAAAPAMALPAELRQLDAFKGTWRCTGKAFATSMGPEHATSARVTAAWVMGGHWMDFRYTEDKTAANPMPYSGYGYWGWDPDQKKLVSGWVDNTGGYDTQASEGWVGDKFVFAGVGHMGMGAPVNGRDTMVRKGNNQLVHSFEMEMKGEWVKTDEETCNREMPKAAAKK